MTSNKNSADGFTWILHPDNGGRKDPLSFAQEWFQGKAERAKLIALKESELEAQALKDQASTQGQGIAESRRLAAASPSYSRSGFPGDIQHAGGVYPTPPDGINGPAARGPASVEANAATPGALIAGSSTLSQDDGHIDTGNRHSAEFEMKGDSGIFGAADEEMLFEENDITEADFSFFDEPELEEDVNPMEGVDAQNQIEDDDHSMKDAPEQAQITEHEETREAIEAKSPLPGRAYSSQNLEVSTTDLREISSPFTPGHILQRLLPLSGPDPSSKPSSEIQDSGSFSNGQAQLGSAVLQANFEAIALNQALKKSDEKYKDKGRFADHRLARSRFDQKVGNQGARSVPYLAVNHTQSMYSTDPVKSTTGDYGLGDARRKIARNAPPDIGLDIASGSSSDSESPVSERSASRGLDDVEIKDMQDSRDRNYLNHEHSPTFGQKNSQNTSLVKDEDVDAEERIPDSSVEMTGGLDTRNSQEVLVAKHGIVEKISPNDCIKLAQLVTDQSTTRNTGILTSVTFKQEFSEVGSSLKEAVSVNTAMIDRMNSPHVKVRRGDSIVELLAPAILFWDLFGLSPISGPKNINCFCVVPPGDGLVANAKLFLGRVGAAYSSSRLGKHTTGMANGVDDGTIAIKLPGNGSTPEVRKRYFVEMARVCAALGASLASNPKAQDNTVIYMIDAFGDDLSLLEMSTAFYGLVQTYSRSKAKGRPRTIPDVVLQIVPVDFLGSRKGIEVPEYSRFSELAYQVYERCTIIQQDLGQSAPVYHAPRFTLSQPPPKSIDFKLTSQPSLFNMYERSYLHLAYSGGVHTPWVSASWTDSWGGLRYSASYALGNGERIVGRPFSEVLREMWDTTADIIRSRPAKWRLLVIRVGTMGSDEREAAITEWMHLSARPGSPSMGLTLLSTDLEVPLESEHILSAMQSRLPSVENTPGALSTPVATPMAGIQSPDQGNNAGTPSGGGKDAPTPTENAAELEVDATLVDTSDDSWSVVLPPELTSIDGSTEQSPNEGGSSPTKGWLVKKAGPAGNDNLVAMAVRVMHSSEYYSGQMKEILEMYRGLGVVGKFRGVEDGKHGLLPLHVTSAVKAQETLSSIM